MESVRRQREQRRQGQKREREYPEPSAGTLTLESDKKMIVQAISQTRGGPSKQTELRLAVTQMMTNPAFQPDYCNFDYIHKLKPNKKDSKSETSVFFGELTKPPIGHSNDVEVSVKMALQTKNVRLNNSLPMERINYQIIANSIILNEWSPHLIAYVASFSCDRSQYKLLKDESVIKNIQADFGPLLTKIEHARLDAENLKIQLKKLNELSDDIKDSQDFIDFQDQMLTDLAQYQATVNMYDTNKLDFLITEKAHNAKSLDNWMDTQQGDINLFTIKSILFQILYTFEVFNRIGFRHNDAHAGNILVENWLDNKSVPVFSTYNVDGVIFQVPTKSTFVKIFDFDRSSFSCDKSKIHPSNICLIDAYEALVKKVNGDDDKECRNTLLDNSPILCRSYGACNTPNNKYDTFLTLKAIFIELMVLAERLSENRLNSSTATNVASWIDQQISGAEKYTATENGQWLKPEHVPTDKEMPTPLTMLKSGFFDEFVTSVKSTAKAPVIYHLPEKL